MDGSQRRLLHRRQTEIPEGRARAGPLVPLGSVDDLAERNGAACSSSTTPAVDSSIPTLRTFRKRAASPSDSRCWSVDGSSTIWRCDRLWASRKPRSPLFSLLMIAVLAWGLMHVFSGRAAYIHVGAVFGTIMTANVWFRILPSQRKMIAAAAAGEKFDRVARRSSQAAIQTQYFHGGSGCLYHDQQSLSRRDLREQVWVGSSGRSRSSRLGGGEGDTGSLNFREVGSRRRNQNPVQTTETTTRAAEVIARCQRLASFSEDAGQHAPDVSVSAHA